MFELVLTIRVMAISFSLRLRLHRKAMLVAGVRQLRHGGGRYTREVSYADGAATNITARLMKSQYAIARSAVKRKQVEDIHLVKR